MVAWILGSEFLHIEDLTWILNRILRIDLVKKKKLKTIFFFKKILQYMRSQTQVIKKKKKKLSIYVNSIVYQSETQVP